jgi:hypothetical protein
VHSVANGYKLVIGDMKAIQACDIGGIKVINTGIGYGQWSPKHSKGRGSRSAANKSDGRTAQRMEAMSAQRTSWRFRTLRDIRCDPWSRSREKGEN